MGRRKKIEDHQIWDAMERIQKKEISLRGMAKELGIDHKSLSERIKKEEGYVNLFSFNNDLVKPPTERNKPPLKEEIPIDLKYPKLFEIKTPQITPQKEIYIDSDTLRAINKFIYGGSTREKREILLDKFIEEFQNQKGLSG